MVTAYRIAFNYFTSSALDFLLGNDNDKRSLACQLRWNCEVLLIVHQQKKTARLSGEGQWLSRKNVFSDFRGVFFRDLLSNKTNITLMSGVDFRAESPPKMPHKDNDNFITKTILIHFYCLSLVNLNARPHKRQRFNHHRVEIKVIVSYCTVLFWLLSLFHRS